MQLQPNYVPLPQSLYQQQIQQQQQPPRSTLPIMRYQQQPYQLIPMESVTGGGNPQQGQFANIGTPSSSVPYYIPGGAQPQQFYDPVQQQYYTITPGAPVSQQQSQNGQQVAPQPQFFPTSPRGAPVLILSTSPAAQPFGSAYFSQFAGAPMPQSQQQAQPQAQSQPQSQQGQQASQKNIHPMYLNGDLSSPDERTNEGTQGVTQTGDTSLHPNIQRNLSADEVSTLKSGPIEQEQRSQINANGDINIIVSDDK